MEFDSTPGGWSKVYIENDLDNMFKLTNQEKNKLVAQYEPLINKLVSQFYHKVTYPWNDLKSIAYEGFSIAIRDYDETKSKQSFTQYAAFVIRNRILSCLDEELRVVKLSAYAQKKVVQEGGTTFNTISIDQPYVGDEDTTPREIVMGMYENEKFSNGDVIDYLCKRLEEHFEDVDCKIFYMTFGFKGYDETSGKNIAKTFNVSEGRISQRLKKVLDYIRQDQDLCEMLATLREGVR